MCSVGTVGLTDEKMAQHEIRNSSYLYEMQKTQDEPVIFLFFCVNDAKIFSKKRLTKSSLNKKG
jgi:hypothetical protein